MCESGAQEEVRLLFAGFLSWRGKRPQLLLQQRLSNELVHWLAESRKATDCTPATSKRLRHRIFLQATMSSRRTM